MEVDKGRVPNSGNINVDMEYDECGKLLLVFKSIIGKIVSIRSMW